MKSNNIETGIIAEEHVAQYLIGLGYTLADRNYRTKLGEIDIVAFKNGVVSFIEVKANRISYAGGIFGAETRADKAKLRKVRLSAEIYLTANKYPRDQPWQIDVIAVTLDNSRNTPKIKHFKNVDVE